ncbi:hypothetical protein ACFWJ4_27900 [Kitasatospora sp. NPDC127067]|uniref:hypothetical protein n=1 Tax=Kitasatospora sp. NPDC127067 TaxID=3347126 RepID=UPI00364D4D3C
MNTFARTKAMNAVEDSSRSPRRARARGGRTVKVLPPDRIGGSLPPGGGGRDSPRTASGVGAEAGAGPA